MTGYSWPEDRDRLAQRAREAWPATTTPANTPATIATTSGSPNRPEAG